MENKQGNLSINSENLFPIIKKWLYSDHDIFYRELISNGCDAVTKLHKLAGMGEVTIPEGKKERVVVVVDEKEHTIRVIDTGIGMTFEEVDEYINQIAFSGATAFIEKYKDKTSDDQIIGHFGLGFYSAFMVADQVTIDTLSCQEGAAPVHWTCNGGTEYSMEEGARTEVGTEITLYLNEDSYEFSHEYRAREIIEKYCSFMPVEIYLFTTEAWEKQMEREATEVVEPEAAEAAETVEAEEAAENVEGGESAEEDKEEEEEKKEPEPQSLSDTNPLWAKHPNDCTEEEYKEFYRKVFHDYKEPLFWIHLNMDYPFNLKGILYFPKINNEYESAEGTIKLYNNRVFIADNIKEVIPEFLLLLKGVIDCPDLPLNVSRSALQNDGFVKKISDYITKKVADKLNALCNTERESYEKYWEDIHPFIKYGCLKDEKFYDRVKESLLFRDLSAKYLTLKDLNEMPSHMEDDPAAPKEEGKETPLKEVITVGYVTDEVQQSQYIKMYQDAGMNAVVLPSNLDSPFITMLEQKNEKLHFQRIDADVTGDLRAADEAVPQETTDTLTEIFRKALDREDLAVKVENLKDEGIASMLTLSEESRRMQEMLKMYGISDMGQDTPATLVLNTRNPLVRYILENREGEHTEMFCKQVYDLAAISHEPMKADAMAEFVRRSNEIMLLLTK
ncbi:MAG: molecular chaperone HtpG [Lachnospiraceae bacterium]|nr:molecular chaperone HtpG [Lachnospiraceae bacterium]